MKLCSYCVHFGKCFGNFSVRHPLVYRFLLHSADTCKKFKETENNELQSKIAECSLKGKRKNERNII